VRILVVELLIVIIREVKVVIHVLIICTVVTVVKLSIEFFNFSGDRCHIF
jgi:Na+-translocating ferredoxin:NAD+ oxidoreductase RnfE subunit